MQDRVGVVDLLFSGNSYTALTILLQPLGQPEVEAIVIGIDDDSHFQAVVLHQLPAASSVQIGDLIRVSDAGAKFECAECTSLDPTTFSFRGSSDLQVGQVVSVRVQSADTSTPTAITTDRVRLKNTAVTGQVQAVLNPGDVVLANLNVNLPGGRLEAKFQSIANIGDLLSVSGHLFNVGGKIVSPDAIAQKR